MIDDNYHIKSMIKRARKRTCSPSAAPTKVVIPAFIASWPCCHKMVIFIIFINIIGSGDTFDFCLKTFWLSFVFLDECDLTDHCNKTEIFSIVQR